MLHSTRTWLRPIEEFDFPAVLDVRWSNPAHLARAEGNDGRPGYFDADMLAREVGVSEMDPARRLDVILLRPADADADGGSVVGFVDFLLENPGDGHPWLGGIELHAEKQRRGLGREVVDLLVRSLPGPPLRCRTRQEPDTDGFARACGFRPLPGSLTWEMAS